MGRRAPMHLTCRVSRPPSTVSAWQAARSRGSTLLGCSETAPRSPPAGSSAAASRPVSAPSTAGALCMGKAVLMQTLQNMSLQPRMLHMSSTYCYIALMPGG